MLLIMPSYLLLTGAVPLRGLSRNYPVYYNRVRHTTTHCAEK